jgi:hypothetical protein
MTLPKALLLFVFVAAPLAAHAASAPPCGWSGGSLSDPARTQSCLAARFQAPKPKPPAPRRAQAPTNTPAPAPAPPQPTN